MIELNKKIQQYADMWFARNKDGLLYIYKAKPFRDEEHGEWEELELEENYQPFFLYKDYPDITWENSPIRLEDYFKKKFIKETSPLWKKSAPERTNTRYLIKFVDGGIVETDDYRETENKFYYEDGEHYYNISLYDDALYGWMYSMELMSLPVEEI